MRIVSLAALIPVVALGACQVTENPQNNTSTVTLSGQAAENGTASALDTASKAVDSASNKIDQVTSNGSDVHAGLSNLAASAGKLGHSVDHAADRLGDAVDGKHKDTSADSNTASNDEKK